MKRIPQDLFHQFNFLGNLKESKDGKILFTITKQNVEANNYVSHIYQLKDGKVKQLTNGKSESYYVFEDDDTILFAANRSEEKTVNTQIYRLSLSEGGEATLAFKLPLALRSIRDIGSQYLVSASTDLNCPDYHLLDKEEQLKHEKFKEENKDYQVVDEYPYMFNGLGFINGTRSSLYLVDKETLACKRVGNATLDVESFDYHDGKILITGIDYTSVKGKWAQVYQYDIEKDELECLYPHKDMSIMMGKYVGDKIIVNGSYGKKYGVGESGLLHYLEDGKMRLAFDFDRSLWNTTGSDSKMGHGKPLEVIGETLYLTPTFGPNAPLAKVENDKLEVITNFSGSVNDYVVSENGTIMVIAMEDQKLEEIYQVNEDGSLKQLTHINDCLLEDYYVAKPERVVVEKESGNVEGWVLKPFEYDPNKKYPAILDIHGGPRSAYSTVYFHEMQYWASEGYVVMYCNPHGSDGYGNQFADIRKEKYGTIDYQDLMDFTDEVIKRYSVDEKKVAVTGGSYGGFMTNWIIGHTDRFACAVSQRSISNWMSMLAASDFGVDVPYEHGFDNIYDCTKEIWRVSPLKYALNVKTPTLFIHSFEDYRCPYPEGLQLYTAIRLNGVEARMCLFKGENHELSRSGKPLHRSRRLKEITDWIKKYTKES